MAPLLHRAAIITTSDRIGDRFGDRCYRRPGPATPFTVRSWGLEGLIGQVGLGSRLGLGLVSVVTCVRCGLRCGPMWSDSSGNYGRPM